MSNIVSCMSVWYQFKGNNYYIIEVALDLDDSGLKAYWQMINWAE